MDIDGCLLTHVGETASEIAAGLVNDTMKLIPGTKEKFDEWKSKGYVIIITTGRSPSLKRFTEKQLIKHGLVYDRLIMGCPAERHLVNDLNYNDDNTAFAHNLVRNKEGIKDLDI